MKKIIFRLSFTIVIMSCSATNNEKVDFELGQETDIIDDDSENNNDNSEYNLLFIGNSLTSSNNLPDLVKSYAMSQGKQISVKAITRGNTALIDHWNDGGIQSQIETGNYDFVIVQQGPSSQPYGRELLIEYGGYISGLCKKNDTKLAYYMVWPSRAYYHTFDGVIYSYREAANRTNDILCPVGEVWKSYFDQTSDFSYYGFDDFHPSLKGSNVAAQVIYESLFSN